MERCVKWQRFGGQAAEANYAISFGVTRRANATASGDCFAGTYQDENSWRSGQQKL
jgi:hypothetical protein